MSLVNDSLKFTSSDTQICWNIRILCIESAKTVNEMTLNELVKLMTLWTTGPRCWGEWKYLGRFSSIFTRETTFVTSYLSSCISNSFLLESTPFQKGCKHDFVRVTSPWKCVYFTLNNNNSVVLTFIIEPIYSANILHLVVASEQEEILGIFDLVSHQLDWLQSPVTKYFSHNPVW